MQLGDWILTIAVSLLIFGVLQTYLFYPLYLKWRMAKLKSRNKEFDLDHTSNLPEVAIVIAAHNEEAIIYEKLESIYQSTYPLEKITVYLGSDQSTDQTDAIAMGFADRGLVFERFERCGKIQILNCLMKKVKQDLTIFTDANIIFETNLISQLVAEIQGEKNGLVGAYVKERGDPKNRTGIYHQESEYIKRELRMKNAEGELWGCMMGAFGACFMMRTDLFDPVPENFVVDDFFITMRVIQKGWRAEQSLSATCYEDVSNKASEEFRRKARMGVGNFQNLKHFFPQLFSKRKGLALAFLSHKVLRWLSPLFLILALTLNYFLLGKHPLLEISFILQSLFLCLPALDFLLRNLGIHSALLRFISYFYSMNLALLVGFFRFLIGTKRTVWKPTERNQN